MKSHAVCGRPLAPCLDRPGFINGNILNSYCYHSLSPPLHPSRSPYMSILWHNAGYVFCLVHGNCSVPGECVCDAGYSGTLCTIDVDVCGHQSPCENNGTCTNTGPDTHSCECPPQFHGPNCEEDVDECSTSNPCLNGSTCMVSHYNYNFLSLSHYGKGGAMLYSWLYMNSILVSVV